MLRAWGADLPFGQAVVECFRTDTKDNDEIYPPAREEVTGVPVDQAATVPDLALHFIQQLPRRQAIFPMATSDIRRSRAHLILIDDPARTLIVPALMALSILNEIVHGQMPEPASGGEHLAMRRLADPRRSSDDYVWRLPLHIDSCILYLALTCLTRPERVAC